MLCQFCHQSPATVQMTTTVNGTSSLHHLCADCARQQGLAPFGNLPAWLTQIAGFSQSAQQIKICPACGQTAQQLSDTGRVGCARCYTTFADLLLPYIRQIHGTVEHTTTLPAPPQTTRQQLQAQMQQAVEQQNFEEAARLRDLLKESEGAR